MKEREREDLKKGKEKPRDVDVQLKRVFPLDTVTEIHIEIHS